MSLFLTTVWRNSRNKDFRISYMSRIGLFKGDFMHQTKGQINYLCSNLSQIIGQIKYLGSSLMFYQIKGFIKCLGLNLNKIKVHVKSKFKSNSVRNNFRVHLLGQILTHWEKTWDKSSYFYAFNRSMNHYQSNFT